MSAVPDYLLTSDEFIEWAMRQPGGRYELVAGRIVAMAPERARHNLVKAQVWRALSDGVVRAGLACTVYADGMTVVIDRRHSREPDAAVQCGGVDPDSVILDAPVIVVEVISPSSERDDTGAKLVEYFSVEAIQHYLIVNPEKSVVVHHQRDGSEIRTRIVGEDGGILRFDPPGFVVSAAALLDEP